MKSYPHIYYENIKSFIRLSYKLVAYQSMRVNKLDNGDYVCTTRYMMDSEALEGLACVHERENWYNLILQGICSQKLNSHFLIKEKFLAPIHCIISPE